MSRDLTTAGSKLKTGKTPPELYQEREKRITDAIQLKIPDRVPVALLLGYFPAKYTGITCEVAYYDAAKWKWACQKTVQDFEPDFYSQTAGASGLALEALDAKQIKWPGHGVSPNYSHQMVELEPMKEDDYDAFFADPSDFVMRTYLPRVWGATAPFAKLPAFRTLIGGATLASIISQLAAPDFVAAFEAFGKAVNAAAKWRSEMIPFAGEMESLGFPAHNSLLALAPFDVVSDNLRGMRGTMLDMYKHPDELLRLCEMLVPAQLERAAIVAQRLKNKRVFMPLHRGSDGFMSLKQFETFYWPTLKKVILALVDMGLTPCPFFEGIWDQRLEYLRELPKGKVLCHLAQTDMARAKEVLGGHLCIMGNIPSSLMQVGTVQEVKDYCKNLIDVCGKDGGFILTPMPIDEANPENVKAMVDFTKEYGVYS